MLRTTTQRIATRATWRLPVTCTNSFHLSTPFRSESDSDTGKEKDKSEELEAVKARAWYLDSNTSHPNGNTETSSAAAAAAAAAPSRQPRFTTFDPLRTMPIPLEQVVIPPLPTDTPTYLTPLHEFLTSNELIVPQTVMFRRTANSAAGKTFHDPSIYSSSSSSGAYGHGKRRRGHTDSGQGIVIEGKDVGANWEWVVVCQVAARGKGAVSVTFSSWRACVRLACLELICWLVV
ncbi:hypothetical protein QFC22_003598 [Naganishia vaughanmartiniae]|uniref:Uncharacterized protein n=1 Tax=Naganishia vaughanmartiniae TaxID=1424756 RepID=A0ACC2X5B8_9TREE|nr:hypothetical protein QFC22_003598 [Naganishia vaughanmartiniae]